MPRTPPRPTAEGRHRLSEAGVRAPMPGLRSRIALAGAVPFATGTLVCALLPLTGSGVNVVIALAAAGLVAALGALSVGMLLRSVVAPITRFTSRAQALAAKGAEGPGGLSSGRLPIDETPELARLAVSLNGLLDALDREGARSARLYAESNDRIRRRAEELDSAEKELVASRGELYEAARLGQLVSRVAHELNDPLATVCGYTELLERWPDMPPEARQRITIVRAQADRCRRMIRDLLVFIRKVRLQHEPVSLNELVSSTTEAQRASLLDWGIEPDVVLDKEDPHVPGDRAMLEEVLVHLITNARDALNSRAGARTLQMKTRVTGDEAQIVVMDNGPGLPGALKDTLFSPPGDGRPGAGAAGLGLSFCQGIIQEHSGRIQAFNRPGGGASFVISLPLITATELEDQPMPSSKIQTPAPRSAPASGATPSPLRVLVVDDEPEIATLIEEALSDEGHSVTKALNGTRAIGCLGTGEFDLIISDLRMPGMSGPQLHEQVRLRWPEMLDRLVFITGDQSGDETLKFLQSSRSRCLGKPFRVSELQKLVGQFSRRQSLTPRA